MFERLGRSVAAHPWLVCAAWLACAGILTAVAPSWSSSSQDDDIQSLPASCASIRGHRALERAFPNDAFASRAIVVLERADGPLTTGDLAVADRISQVIDELRQAEPNLKITGVAAHRTPIIGPRLVSDDRQCTLIQISLATPYIALQTRETVDRCEAEIRAAVQDAPTGLVLKLSGPAGVGRDLIRASSESLDHTTWATIALVIVVLLMVYRSPVMALVPLVTIGVSSWAALSVLALSTCIPGVKLANVSQVFAVVILFGAGTDYCLFLIGRYREELANGVTGRDALERCLGAVGGAITASAGTVICGLAMMGFAEFAKIRCAGPVIAVALFIGLAASLTLTPALLRILGEWAFWPTRIARGDSDQRWTAAIWEWVSRLVTMRPGWVLGVALAILIPLAAVGLRITPTFSAMGDLSAASESVQGIDIIRRHFTPGEIGPTTVVLAADQDWNSPAGRALIERLSRGFAHLDNVAEVRSLTQPLGRPGPAKTLTQKLALAGAAGHYVASCPDGAGRQYVTRIEVVLRSDPFAAESHTTLAVLETWLRDFLPANAGAVGPVDAECYGATVCLRDLARVIETDRARINTLVMAGILLILLALVKKPLLALYLLATVLLGYLATLGMTAIFATVWCGKPFGDIEWRVPFFLFTILVAVGEDYNILMMARILSEQRRHGHLEGVRRGLARTGGLITACGIIMAGTFATLTLTGLGTLEQIGFALSAGVLLDTLVIRTFVVPAFLALTAPPESEPATLPFPVPQSARRAA